MIMYAPFLGKVRLVGSGQEVVPIDRRQDAPANSLGQTEKPYNLTLGLGLLFFVSGAAMALSALTSKLILPKKLQPKIPRGMKPFPEIQFGIGTAVAGVILMAFSKRSGEF